MKHLQLTMLWVGTQIVTSRPEFPDYVPNGRHVVFQGGIWEPLGHMSRDEPSPSFLNPFGRDVRATLNNGNEYPVWSELCPLDSDGDGLTNGEELLDPECVWKNQDDNDLLVNGTPTHPGFNTTIEVATEIKVHTVLMCIAWLFFAPLGILTAAIFKVKKQIKHFNWFKIHKICVGTAVYLTLIAYVVMVNYTESFILDTKHTRLGHAVVIIAIFQPISGFYRIHIHEDGSKSYFRLAWEYFHQWVGRSLAILAAINIYFGFDIVDGYSDALRKGFKGLDIALLGACGIFCIIWVFARKDERKDPALPLQKKAEMEEEGITDDGATTKTTNQTEASKTTTSSGAPTSSTASTTGTTATKGEAPVTDKTATSSNGNAKSESTTLQ